MASKGASTGLEKCFKHSLHPEKECVWKTAEDRNDSVLWQTWTSPSPPVKSQTCLSEGKAQSFVCSWSSCSLLLNYPRNVTPDKSLLKTSLFPSELLPLQKGKFHSSCPHPNSPLTGQKSLAFPICQTLNHLSKEVPGSDLALSSSFCSNVSDMSFLLCSILLCTAKLTPPPFPLPLAAILLYTREPGHHKYLRPLRTWKQSQHKHIPLATAGETLTLCCRM